MVTVAPSLRLVLGRPAVLVVAATLFPAVLCTLLTWWLLPDWWQLSAYFWYSIPGNSFLWLPHEPAVIYAGAIYAPALVAAVGGLGTALASIVDHAVFTRVLRLERLVPVKQTRIARLSVNLFNRQPWWTIVFFALTPVPFYPIRVLAPMSNYPMALYVSAVVVGRVPRYFVLALGGAWAKSLTWPYLPW